MKTRIVQIEPNALLYHLRNVFVKLGIASRPELIRNPPRLYPGDLADACPGARMSRCC